MNTAEHAYDALAKYLLCFIGARQWESAVCKLRVYSNMASSSQWLVANGVADESGGFERIQTSFGKGWMLQCSFGMTSSRPLASASGA
jgi:hypothetical protein